MDTIREQVQTEEKRKQLTDAIEYVEAFSEISISLDNIGSIRELFTRLMSEPHILMMTEDQTDRMQTIITMFKERLLNPQTRDCEDSIAMELLRYFGIIDGLLNSHRVSLETFNIVPGNE